MKINCSNAANRPEIITHLQIIIDIANFLNKLYKEYDFDKVDYLNSFSNNANFSYSIEINIQKITNDYTNNYLKIFLEDKYYQYRLILSKETKYRIDLLRHDSILRAIENSNIARADKNFDIINIISKIRFIKSQLDKINIGFLDKETEKYWIREPVTLSYESIISKYKKLFEIELLGIALINFESNKHINLVWHQANKLEKVFPSRSSSELLSMGWIGLRTALRLFDPNLGFSFSTYACTRISGTIRDFVRTENLVPKRLTTFNRKVLAIEEALMNSLGRSPNVEEIAKSLGIEKTDLAILNRIQTPASLDDMLSDEDGGEKTNVIFSTNNDPAEYLIRAEIDKKIIASISRLDPVDAQIIMLSIFEGKKPSEIENITGENIRKVRLRKERAMLQLRDDLKEWV
jgi:RNA polymerase sigma factor (sigma-70 family)